ncbi:MAG: hypothetical protein COA58_12030 [Bacteroidetes bacterium]|nr:MAG: hypothetical protein COA58_12030 [Bacteroidota bacterium]
MKSLVLLPNGFKKVGWILLALSVLMWSFHLIWDWEPSWMEFKTWSILNSQFLGESSWMSFKSQNMFITVVAVIFIIGGLVVGFSKEKVEDEFITTLRLNSLMWAVLVGYLVLVFLYLTVYGLAFLNVLAYQMFAILLLFIFRFHYLLYKHNSKG